MSYHRKIGSYVEVTTEVDVDVDLYDCIYHIASLYNDDEVFRKQLSTAINHQGNTDEVDLHHIITELKIIRKNDVLWQRLKPDLEEMLKEDYVVIL